MTNTVIQEWTDEKGWIHRIEIPLTTFLIEHNLEPVVKHGHWVEDKERPWRWICSECDTYMSNEIDRNMDMNYCPNCGAKMDEVAE